MNSEMCAAFVGGVLVGIAVMGVVCFLGSTSATIERLREENRDLKNKM